MYFAAAAAAALLMALPPPMTGRQPQWRPAAEYRPRYLRPMADGHGVALPRRQWRQASRAGALIGEHLLGHRKRLRYLTTTVHPVLGHWRALRDKLEVQSMWPGTARHADEAHLLATTVRITRHSDGFKLRGVLTLSPGRKHFKGHLRDLIRIPKAGHLLVKR